MWCRPDVTTGERFTCSGVLFKCRAGIRFDAEARVASITKSENAPAEPTCRRSLYLLRHVQAGCALRRCRSTIAELDRPHERCAMHVVIGERRDGGWQARQRADR